MSRVTPRLIARLGPGADDHDRHRALAVGYVWLSSSAPPTRYLGAVFGPMLIAGLATGFVFMPVTATVLGGVEPEHAGSASGLLQTTQQLGGAVGVAAIVSVYAAGAVPGEFVPGRAGGVPHLGGLLAGRPSWSRRWRSAPRRPPEPGRLELEPEPRPRRA